MKVTTSTLIRIEIEPGDTSYDLYDKLGEITGDEGEEVLIVDGALEIRVPDGP